MLLILGIWDVGRVLEAQQLVSNAAREGAGQASVGTMLDSSTGTVKQVTGADVQQTALNYLARNGVRTTGVVVEYVNLDNPGAQPFEAQNLDHLRVTVRLPFRNVRLILVNLFTDTNYNQITGVADWYTRPGHERGRAHHLADQLTRDPWHEQGSQWRDQETGGKDAAGRPWWRPRLPSPFVC